MPKKAFHVPEEYLETYEKFKAMTEEFDETISSVLLAAMQRYIDERAEQLQDVDEIFVWEGSRIDGVESSGRLVRFYGKKIAEATVRDVERKGEIKTGILYYTKKKKFLYQVTIYDGVEEYTEIQIKDTVAGLKGDFPEIVEQMKTSRVVAEFLDV